ncbi:hypothetical protein JRO89_XS03G0231700 [Xanthoceras sorbifolium]|uniref:Cryptochrome DASH n=1 Tax=Xanthoceras sorbifolium TaxID=99658 RepID=A0ABQ8IBU1_9ROSI|nr:hypothetical protein JRO89_XS03G0231700 [Xanthoceras sorbifolium]
MCAQNALILHREIAIVLTFHLEEIAVWVLEKISDAQVQAVHVPNVRTVEIWAIGSQANAAVTKPGLSKVDLMKTIGLAFFSFGVHSLLKSLLVEMYSISTLQLWLYSLPPTAGGGTLDYFLFTRKQGKRSTTGVQRKLDSVIKLAKYWLNSWIQSRTHHDIFPLITFSFVYSSSKRCKYTESITCTCNRVCYIGSEKMAELVGDAGNTVRTASLLGCQVYMPDDNSFPTAEKLEVNMTFHSSVEAKCNIRGCIKIPASLGPLPSVDDWGSVPSIDQLGLQSRKASLYVSKGMKFVGGESAALGRVYEYFWKMDRLRVYKETRNGMLGPDYSTKFSPWLASGSLSPRYIYEEVKRYERERQANDSTYWVLFELIWRDYFRFISLKYGSALFHLGGPRKVEYKWNQDQKLFESWRDGCTGYPLIDANMKELSATGFMSNRGRQIVCSFLVRDMGIDWRMGAEWFETCLLDYDPCSNYGNWTYGAGVGNDPREDRYFSIPKQAQTYDPEGEYVAYWLPQLQALPKDKRNFPGKSYIEQVVPLKFGNVNRNKIQDKALTGRRTNFKGKQATTQYRQ